MKKNNLVAFLAIYFLVSISLISKADELEDIKKTLPKLLGLNNMGTEFVFGFHPCWEEFGANNAIRIYVSSQYETEVRLTIPDLSKEPYLVKKTIPNSVIEFILSPAVGQPYTRGSGGLVSTLKPTQVWKGRGIILESDAPIIAYGLVRYQYTSDGFLAIPTNKCGNQYLISSYRETTNFTNQSLTPYASIIGIFDSTVVKYYIGGNNATRVRTADGKNFKQYDTMVVSLNRGDYFLVASEGPQSDLGGSYIQANKPISVLSGNHCAYVPTRVAACDYILEQEIPVNYWRDKYYISNIVERKNASVIRMFAKEVNTVFYRYSNNGDSLNEIGYLTQNFGIEGEGWLETRANPDLNLPAIIVSNKPINIVQYNPGMQDDNVPSDPFQMNVLPVSSFQKYFVFNTPGIRGGYGFRKNYINLIYKPTKNNEIPDDLELGEVQKSGDIKWQKVKDLSNSTGTPFKESGTITYYNKIITLPQDGIYHIKSDEPVMAYLYGFADWDSYGMPAAGYFHDSTIIDEIEPKIENKPIVSGNYDQQSGTFIVTDKDNAGKDNLCFAFVDPKNSYNVQYKITKYYNQESKISLIKIDWNVQNLQDSARIVLHAVDNNGNISTKMQDYKPTNPSEKYIKLSNMSKIYYLNNTMKIFWNSNLTEKIKITLLKDKKVEKVINENAENTGEYSFVLDDKVFKVGKNYSISVSGVLSTNIADTSNTFDIESDSTKKIVIIKPDSTYLNFLQDDLLLISWYTYPSNLKVNIQVLDTLGKELVSYSIDTIYSTPSEFSWKIPYDFQPGKYKIRIVDRENSNIFAESPLFNIRFNKFIKKITFFLPNDTSIAYIGESMTISFSSNYFSNFEIWLSLDNALIYKILDNYKILDTLVKYFKFTLPKELMISNKYSITFIDKDNFFNKKNDITYNSKKFLITKGNFVEDNRFNLIVKHISNNGVLSIYTENYQIIDKVEIYDMLGRCIYLEDKINNYYFKIPLSSINTNVILLKLLIENKIIDYKIILN